MLRYLFLLLLVCTCLACEKANLPHETGTTDVTAATASAPGDSLKITGTGTDTAYQIIPGRRIGQVTLGDAPEKVHAVLGPPDAGDAAMGKALSTWYSKENAAKRHQLDVYTVRERTGMPDETVRVHQVRITSPRFTVVKNGLKTGSTLAQIRTHFPEVEAVAYYALEGQQRAYVYDDPEQGIAFEVTGPDSVCVGITIHLKGGGASETYLPVHPGLVQLNQK